MALLGSFPAAVDSSVVIHTADNHPPMIPILAYRPRKRVEFGGLADCKSTGFLQNSKEDYFIRSSPCCGHGGRRRRWIPKRVKATQDGTGGGGSVDDPEDALQATIEKGKKVLAMQKDLLAQIAERKKLISSTLDSEMLIANRKLLVYHGRGPVDDFSFVDLPPHYGDLFKLYDPMGGEHFNIFAAGLRMADRVVTVSHGYSWEINTSEGGWGLHRIINENDWKLRGIVNGIDTKEWSPELDIHLKSDNYVNYSIETLKTGKAQCKTALQKELGLPIRSDVPLVGFIGRLDHEKGVDLIADAVPWMMGQDVQLVMLGSGRPDLEQLLRQFDGQYNDRVRGWVGFCVRTAHRITAGADILLMPSRFEPCGLNQLYALRYGESGLGWTFSIAEANELINALGNCLLTYRQYKTSWEGLQKRCMMQDLSWDNAAQNYEEVCIAAKYQW